MTNRIENETDLIQTYLAPLTRGHTGALNLTDDAAFLSPPAGCDLVVSTDPIIAGVHFFATDRADDIAWKALAVNVSDLVAKGAAPFAYTMTLALPEAPDRTWMATFSQGLAAAQAAFGCTLIGGDTDRTPGPLAVGVTGIGVVPADRMIRRGSARVGDHVMVSGTLGDAALGLKLLERPHAIDDGLTAGDKAFLVGRYLRPQPRIGLLDVLRASATAALDVSDGFLKDAARLTGPLGLTISLERLPLSPSAQRMLEREPGLVTAILNGGDDYEVLFSVAPDDVGSTLKAAATAGISVSNLGVLKGDGGVQVVDRGGQTILPLQKGYDHFHSRSDG